VDLHPLFRTEGGQGPGAGRLVYGLGRRGERAVGPILKRRPIPVRLALAATALWIGAEGGLPAPAAARETLRIARPDLDPPVEDVFPRDGSPPDAVAAALFDRINRDRREHGLRAVLWDEKAAAVARATTRRQVGERTFGHFLLDGFPPYARLSAGGAFGMGAENVAAFMSDAGRLHDTPVRLVLRAEEEMMAETPPRDLHRKAILAPNATHVGIGWAGEGGEFRVAAEFSERRCERLRVLREGRSGASIRIEGRPLSGTTLRYVAVARQPAPRPISRAEANGRDSYAFPAAQLLLLPSSTRGKAVGIPSANVIDVGFSGDFSFPYALDETGLWTFILYFRGKGSGEADSGGAITLLVDGDRR
jgi:uncharacterized protein YkwD